MPEIDVSKWPQRRIREKWRWLSSKGHRPILFIDDKQFGEVRRLRW